MCIHCTNPLLWERCTGRLVKTNLTISPPSKLAVISCNQCLQIRMTSRIFSLYRYLLSKGKEPKNQCKGCIYISNINIFMNLLNQTLKRKITDWCIFFLINSDGALWTEWNTENVILPFYPRCSCLSIIQMFLLQEKVRGEILVHEGSRSFVTDLRAKNFTLYCNQHSTSKK